MEDLISTLAIWALPVIFAITLHEAAHGYVARHFGDPTAYLAGRISLNPLRHVDPVGTLLVPGIILAVSTYTGGPGVLFGWAKPVPVVLSRLRNPKSDMLWVAAAGPGANLAMAIAWAVVLKVALLWPDMVYSAPLHEMSIAGIRINAALMILNLLPIPPLDGGRIAISVLPHSIARRFSQVEPYGLMILMALIVLESQIGLLSRILNPLLSIFIGLLASLFGFY